MRRRVLCFFLNCLTVAVAAGQRGNEIDKADYGIIDDVIRKVIEMVKPQLKDIYLTEQKFESGPQEFGNLKGNIKEVTCKGLENLEIRELKTSLLDINNLTLVEKNLVAEGFYDLDGTLAFPLGKNDIHIFGNGPFRASFTNFSISMKIKIRSENGLKIVKELEIFLGLENMQVELKNLMGGGKLEEVFNQLMNDVGLTIFNYYKDPILKTIKPQIIELINQILNSN